MPHAEPEALGRVISKHNGRILAGGWLLYFGLLFAASAAYWAVQANWGAAAACAGVAAVALFICWRRWNQSATVYEGGIVWRRGRKRKVVRWEEVADVEAETFDDDFTLTVITHDGRELMLDDYLADVKQLHGYLINARRGHSADEGPPSARTVHQRDVRWPNA